MPFLPPNQQRQSTEGISSVKVLKAINSGRKILANLCFMGRWLLKKTGHCHCGLQHCYVMLHEMPVLCRWKDKRAYDILVECADLSLDVSENAGGSSSVEPPTASQPSPQLSHGHCQVVVRCDTIREAVLMCAWKRTWVSLIYRTDR